MTYYIYGIYIEREHGFKYLGRLLGNKRKGFIVTASPEEVRD
jgi:hypothetical protein